MITPWASATHFLLLLHTLLTLSLSFPGSSPSCLLNPSLCSPSSALSPQVASFTLIKISNTTATQPQVYILRRHWTQVRKPNRRQKTGRHWGSFVSLPYQLHTPSPHPATTSPPQPYHQHPSSDPRISWRPWPKATYASQSYSQDTITRSDLSNVNLTMWLLCLKHLKALEGLGEKVLTTTSLLLPHPSLPGLARPLNSSHTELVPLNISSCFSSPWLVMLFPLPGLASPFFRSVSLPHYPVSFSRTQTYLSWLCSHTFSTGLGIIDRICYPEKSASNLLGEERKEPVLNYAVLGTIQDTQTYNEIWL